MARTSATAVWVKITLLLLLLRSMVCVYELRSGMQAPRWYLPIICLTGKTLPTPGTLHGAMQLQYSWPQGKRVGVKRRRRAKVKAACLQMIGTSVVVRGPPLVHCCPLLRPAIGTAVVDFDA